jgi:outer membrane protein assembly factor BamB
MFEPLKVGDRLTNYTGLGVLGRGLERSGSLAGDSQQLYRTRFNQSQAALFAGLSSSSANLDLEVVHDANNNGVVDRGEILGRSAQPGNASETVLVRRNLGTGLYYYRLTNQTNQSTNFQLTLGTDYAGNDLANARPMGVLSPNSPITLSDTVGDPRQKPFDDADYYRFRVTSPQLVTVNTQSVAQQVTLLDSSGRNLGSTQTAVDSYYGNRPLTQLLQTGLYYVEVNTIGPGPAGYSVDLSAITPPLPTDWARSANNRISSRVNASTTRDLAIDSRGHSFLASYSTTQFSGGAYVVEYNALGNEVQQLNIPQAQVATDADVDVAVDGSNQVYLSTWGPSGSILAKYNAQGQQLWQKSLNSQADFRIHDIAVTAGGEIYATGDRTGGAWIAKYSISGDQQWLTDVVSWADGNGGFDFGRHLLIDAQGNLVVSGDTQVGSDRGNFVAKYSSTGSQLWSTKLETFPSSGSAGISLDPEGRLYAANTQGIVAKLSGDSGTLIWSHSLGDGVTLRDIAFGNRALSVIGNTSSLHPTNPSAMFITQIDGATSQPATPAYFARNFATGAQIAVDGQGRLYGAGDSSKALNGVDRTFGDEAFLMRFSRYSVS